MASFFSNLSSFWSPKLFLISIFTLIRTLKDHFTGEPRKHKLPPGPKPWLIVGNLPEMLANKPAFRWVHKLMKDMKTEIACIKLGNVHVIPVSSPSIAREFLKKQDDAFASRPISMSSEFISGGYLTAAIGPFGEQWKKMKRNISKDLLSPMKHRLLHSKRIEEADNLVRYVYSQCRNTNEEEEADNLVNVRTAAQHFCGNVIRKMIFNTRHFGEGRKNGGPGLEETEHVDALFTFLKYLYAFCVSDFIPCLRGLDLDGHERKVKNAMKVINKYHDSIIEGRIKQWKDGIKTEVEDLLDVMISVKDANDKSLLTSEEIKAQIIELMIATVDNPSNAVEWGLAEMINQPELLQRATEELDKVVGKERLVQESDLPKLNYVKACAREAFRLHPIAPFNVPHVSMADAVVANYFIPKGSHVLLSRQELGRNPKVWKEPHKFKPERHLKNDGSDVFLTEPDLEFITFSTGKRGCPGIVLGTSITVMLFARLLHGFTWRAPPNKSSINLSESESDLFLAEPLVAIAKPRLPEKVYLID